MGWLRGLLYEPDSTEFPFRSFPPRQEVAWHQTHTQTTNKSSPFPVRCTTHTVPCVIAFSPRLAVGAARECHSAKALPIARCCSELHDGSVDPQCPAWRCAAVYYPDGFPPPSSSPVASRRRRPLGPSKHPLVIRWGKNVLTPQQAGVAWTSTTCEELATQAPPPSLASLCS